MPSTVPANPPLPCLLTQFIKKDIMKRTNNYSFLIACLAAALLPVNAPAQTTTELRQWQFSRDSLNWQTVTVPHDWAISGPFDKKWDLQKVAIVQNGEKEKTEKSGRSGALPWIGRGYYSTQIEAPTAAGERTFVVFDGAMSNAHVYINGTQCGYWPYGYNAFRVELTPYLHAGSNTLTVSLNNPKESSRWYPGAGLYRPVTLVRTGKVTLDPWYTYLRTKQISNSQATLLFDTQVKGSLGNDVWAVEVQLIDKKGRVAAASHGDVDSAGCVTMPVIVPHAQLWSPESPYLYKAVTTLYCNNKPVSTLTRNTGICTVSVDSVHGFQLNGVSRKLKGVCLHHDLGALGAAVNKAALIRQAKLLKSMGCDAIRTSHNMPSEMQMEVYDSLGLMVMAESFDTWIYPKVKNGYAQFFKQWADKDIETLVRHNRNHPSLVMYSIGNEIPEQWSKEGADIARHLQDICHSLDDVHPVTQGMDRPDAALKSGFAQTMDIPGWNYRVYKYDKAIKQLPQGFQLGSETASTVSSRGVYKFPVKLSSWAVYPDGQCSSYDTEWCSWSNLPDVDFMIQDDRTNTIGQFVWTGFDYLGEPTPYDEYWPSRSSYFGIFDLAGLPKDRYYLYRSQWNKHEHTLHLLPHWTWPGREGKVTPVFCYTDYPEAELFVNGKSQGRIRKILYTVADAASTTRMDVVDSLTRRYRLRWDNVVYQPGNITVVAYDSLGHKAATQTVATAGKPAKLLLQPDRDVIEANGEDLSFVTVSLTDKQGTLYPWGDNELLFSVEGAGTLRGLCNGDATSLEVFTGKQMKLFGGMLVAIVQSNGQKGKINLNVKSQDGKFKATKVIEAK